MLDRPFTFTRAKSRVLAAGSALGAFALVAGLLAVPPASAEEPSTPDEVAAVVETPVEDPESTPSEDVPAARVASAGAFAAGDGEILLTVGQQTGTVPFQADDAAGNDSGPDNDVIRTNDSITFNVGVRFEGEDHSSPSITFTLAQGQSLASLPPFCVPGSSVTPATLPAPESPLTATSWETLPQQTVVCLLADQTAGTSLNYPFVAQVRSEVPNGTVMPAPEFSVTSNEVVESVSIVPNPVAVSSAPTFDLSKRVAATQPNQGPLFQSTSACPDGSGRICRINHYPVSVTVPAGGKGVAPLASPIVFEDNLDPASFFGATVWADMVAGAGSDAAARAAYAPMFASCSNITPGSGFRSSLPFSRIALGNEQNSVRDTGTVSCSTSAPGENGVVTITGTDTTAVTVPSQTGSGGALPSDRAFIVSFELAVAVPQDAVLEFGDAGDGSYALITHNEYVNVQMTSISGQENTDDPSNNDRDASIRLQVNGSFDKFFSGIYGAAGNTPAADFSGNNIWEGSPGAGQVKDGNTVVMPGQAVQSVLSFSESAVAGTGTAFSRTVIGCDVWDADRLALAADPDWRGYLANLPSLGDPVFPVYYTQGNDRPARGHIGTDASTFRNVVVEYSTGAAGPGADADCSTGTWSADPDDIAIPVVDDLGRTVWQGINRVRITFNTEYPVGSVYAGGALAFAIGQVVLDSEDTASIGNWGARWVKNGINNTAETLADPDGSNIPAYNPETHNGALGDRLIQGEAIVRVGKFVENPSTGEFTDTIVPQYTAGSNVRYRLDPSLTTSVPVEGSGATVVVEDCLPPFQVYVEATQAGAALAPELVQMGAPGESELACGSNQQYLRWNLGTLAIGAPIEPIVVTAEILETARNGVYTNEVLVSSSADQSPASLRSDDVQVQLVVPTGVKISKTVDKTIIEVNPVDVETPRTLTWSVYFANIDSPVNVANVDVIDVLPGQGVNGSDFVGALRFDDAVVAEGTGISIQFTRAPTAQLEADPAASSNSATGATVWCDAIAGSVTSGAGTAANCPQTAAEVTGLRLVRPGSFTPEDEFRIDIAMTPVENAGGDRYRNITAGRADGVTQSVGPAARAVEVISSSIGDVVWEDLNANGLQDQGEPGIEGFPVILTGTDLDGNPVSLTTVTDEQGNYLFANLASGTYTVTFDPNGLTSNSTFTAQHVGDDPTIDSDADVVTGRSQEIVLAPDSEDLTIDAGVIIDRNVDIVLDKTYLGATEPDADHTSIVTYELEVTNNGTAEGPYDLTDTLLFGGDVTIGDVKVENTSPGDIVTNPEFDGVTDTSVVSGEILPGLTTHTYLVTVEAQISTTITSEATECRITDTESGSGFMNAAELSVRGTTVTDLVCGDVPTPPTSTAQPKLGLPVTGGQIAGSAAAAVLLLGVGAAMLMLRRRRAQRNG